VKGAGVMFAVIVERWQDFCISSAFAKLTRLYFLGRGAKLTIYFPLKNSFWFPIILKSFLPMRLVFRFIKVIAIYNIVNAKI